MHSVEADVLHGSGCPSTTTLQTPDYYFGYFVSFDLVLFHQHLFCFSNSPNKIDDPLLSSLPQLQ